MGMLKASLGRLERNLGRLNIAYIVVHMASYQLRKRREGAFATVRE